MCIMLRSSTTTDKESNHQGVIKKKVTNIDLERLEVARLTCDIQPCSKPSGLFEKLQEKRKIRHENVLEQLAKSLHEVNVRTEKNITMSSAELKAHVKDYDDKLRLMLESIDRIEVASYCESAFVGLQKKANEYKAEQQKLVNEFYQDLVKFENKRAKENGRLLHLVCEEIRKIGYFLPYDVQAFAEGETLKLNQLSLNNRRCYEDLKLTLTLVTEQTFKSFMDKVFCIRDKWVQSTLHNVAYNIRTETEENSGKFLAKTYGRLELKGEELAIRIRPNNLYSSCTAEEWIANVEKVVATIVKLAKNLIEVYKKAVKAIYEGFNAEVEEIKGGLSLIENLAIEERLIKPLIIEVKNSQTKEIEELEAQWQNTLEDVRNQLRYVAEFSQDIGKLWDHHVKRVSESKKLILKALERADQNNKTILLDLETKLNLGLDALRQEHVYSKLEKNYEAVVMTLEALKSKYESVYLDEVSIVEDFYKMMKIEADVLSADIQEFIYETNTVKFIQVYSGQFRFLREIDFGGKSLFRDMKSCAQQVHNLKFWKQGLVECELTFKALETMSGRTRECLEPKANSWIKSKVETLAEKKSTQLELLEKRFKRIKVEIYERRIGEVKSHREMFDKHKERIRMSLKKAKEDLQNLLTIQLKKIDYIRDNLTEIEDNGMLENLPGVIRGNRVMIERTKEEVEKDLETDFERFRAYCKTRMADSKQVNINYMKSIKLFHENGNYSIEEAKSIINLLEVIDKDISSELKSVVKDSIKEENGISKKLSGLFSSTITLFDLLYEETLFNHEIQQRLQNFRAHIQDSAKILKSDFDFFNQHYYCIRKYMENPPETDDESEELILNFLTQVLYRNVSNLFHPVQLPKIPAESSEGEEKEKNLEGETTTLSQCCCAGTYPVKFTNSNRFLYRKAVKPEALPCKDYVDQLCTWEDDGTFMGAMCKNFSAELAFIQRVACNFYKNIQGRKIIRDDLIPASYEDFIDGVLTRFSHYNAQIQEFWLQILTDFVPLLCCVKSLAKNFLHKKLQDYKNSALIALKNYEADFKDCLESQGKEISKEFEYLESKLMPLHGYPQNLNLLAELEDLVVRTIANQEIMWEQALKSFKNQLKCFRLHHIQEKREIGKIELQHAKLRDTIFVEKLGSNIIEEIKRTCENGGFCVKDVPKGSSASDRQAKSIPGKPLVPEKGKNPGNEDIPEEHRLLLEHENMNPLWDNLDRLRRMVEREGALTCFSPENESTESYGGDSGEPWQATSGILLEILELKGPVSRVMGALEQCLRHLKGFSESLEKSHEEELFKWLNGWKLNVKKIRKLYRTKCGERRSTLGEVANVKERISDAGEVPIGWCRM